MEFCAREAPLRGEGQEDAATLHATGVAPAEAFPSPQLGNEEINKCLPMKIDYP